MNRIDKNIRKDSRLRFLINITEYIGFNEIIKYDTFKKLEYKFNSHLNNNFNYIAYIEEDNQLEKEIDKEYYSINNSYKELILKKIILKKK